MEKVNEILNIFCIVIFIICIILYANSRNFGGASGFFCATLWSIVALVRSY
jgi:hypothetical protein